MREIAKKAATAGLIILAVLFAAGLTNAETLSAAAFCEDRAGIAERLGEMFSEVPVAMGVASNGMLIEVFSALDGSFTILATQPGGEACVVATGEDWETLDRREFPPREQAS